MKYKQFSCQSFVSSEQDMFFRNFSVDFICISMLNYVSLRAKIQYMDLIPAFKILQFVSIFTICE